jgi:hypothetical protein
LFDIGQPNAGLKFIGLAEARRKQELEAAASDEMAKYFGGAEMTAGMRGVEVAQVLQPFLFQSVRDGGAGEDDAHAISSSMYLIRALCAVISRCSGT